MNFKELVEKKYCQVCSDYDKPKCEITNDYTARKNTCDKFTVKDMTKKKKKKKDEQEG